MDQSELTLGLEIDSAFQVNGTNSKTNSKNRIILILLKVKISANYSELMFHECKSRDLHLNCPLTKVMRFSKLL